jgi:diguanylate cyclase (GGDEF)-like protein
MSNRNVVARLGQLELFSDLDQERLEQLVEIGSFHRLDSGEVVFREGDEGDILYLILEGQVRVTTKADPDKVFYLKTGDVMGEIALLDGLPRTATVTTDQPCHLFRLSRGDLESFFELEPSMALKLMKVMNRKIRATLGREKELNASLRQANAELERLNETLESLVEQKTEQLRNAIKDLKSMVERDALTGVFNRRKFDSLLEELVTQKERLALVMLDVDHFKNLNDTHGHQAGDRVLMQVAAVAEGCLDEGQYLARYGGEEFAILLEEAAIDQALEVAEKVRLSIESHHFPIRDCERGYVRASLGVASYPYQAESGSSLIAAADKALYRAKENGRNRVEAAQLGEAATP